MPDSGIDLSTICLLTDTPYPVVEGATDVLCNYLILERTGTIYQLNQFAEVYIVQRFIPDVETYSALSADIERRQRQIKEALNRLEEDMIARHALAKVIRDWHIITDSDRITAAKMYDLYGRVRRECNRGGRFHVESMLQEFIIEIQESEHITAHPFV